MDAQELSRGVISDLLGHFMIIHTSINKRGRLVIGTIEDKTIFAESNGVNTSVCRFNPHHLQPLNPSSTTTRPEPEPNVVAVPEKAK